MTQYSGKIIRKNPVTPTQQSASGVWTTADAAAAVKNNNWPVAGVPNPISRSLRFRSSASAYFNRTPGTASNRTTWTWSGWVKRGALSTSSVGGVFGIFGGGTLGTSQSNFVCYFNSNYDIYLQETVNNVSNQLIYETTSFYRDPSAWYHIVIAMDTTQATAANRTKIYVNGVQAPGAFSVTPGQNQALSINNTVPQYIGGASVNPQAYGNVLAYFDGYITEVNFIDGQQLTPSSFGTTDSITGAWVPMPYTGTYGTNGYYLNFKDNTSTTTIGYDYSGNSNNWTANNISLTAGVTYDSMVDVPTLWMAYNTAGDTGALVRGNYAVFNPLVSSTGTFSSANLNVSTATTNATSTTIFASTGKWYWEVVCTSATVTNTRFGIVNTSGAGTDLGGNANGWAYLGDGRVYTNGASSSYGVSYATNDVLMIALDIDAGKIWYGKNGTWMASGVPSTGTSPSQTFTANQLMSPAVASGSGTFAYVLNCGQRPFSYTPPSGFKTLNTFNLPAPTINNGASYMAATLWTGNGTSQSISNAVNGVSFQPDFVWNKSRSTTYSNEVTDSVRGTTQQLYTNLTDAEYTASNQLTSFNSNGFTIGAGNNINASGQTYVGWQWNAGGSTVTNTSGSISSQVRASTTAGFSVVTYTGTGANATVGHGLGVAPKMIIVKMRSSSGYNWVVYHAATGNTGVTYLNLTNAFYANSAYWNNTSPTSSVFTISTALECNGSGSTYVAYCFAEVAGYSAFGSYTGNGSTDGPFVFLGFRPRFVMIKITSTTGNWFIQDSSTNTSNTVTNYLYADSSAAEATNGLIDFLSNGFKLRNTYATQNPSGGTIIYAAFAENPFKNSNAR